MSNTNVLGGKDFNLKHSVLMAEMAMCLRMIFWQSRGWQFCYFRCALRENRPDLVKHWATTGCITSSKEIGRSLVTYR